VSAHRTSSAAPATQAARVPPRSRRPRAATRADEPDAPTRRFIVLTGLSGSGKTQAVRALEDLGYFCVDNLPLALLPTFAELMLHGGEITRAAVVIDVREGATLKTLPQVYASLQQKAGLDPWLIFLDASDDILVRRFSETRRPHPLGTGRSVIEGIQAERQRFRAIRARADQVIDTSDMTVHELRRAFMSASREHHAHPGPVVTCLSFGFKHGVPLDADLVFDARFLPNPHFVPDLRPRTGKDPMVRAYLDQYDDTHAFIDRVADLLTFLLPRYAEEGKSYVTVAVGCTGGRHRSVAIAEELKRRLTPIPSVRMRVRHRDIARD
jgi:RNase adapter protein RapZ